MEEVFQDNPLVSLNIYIWTYASIYTHKHTFSLTNNLIKIHL